MMVPAAMRAEREEHRVTEAEVMRRLAVAWKCKVTKRPGDDAVDWNAHRSGHHVAVLEFKDRQLSVARRTYPDVWVAESKRLALVAAAPSLGAAFFVFRAAFDDTLHYAPADLLDRYPLVEETRRLPRPGGLTLTTDTELVRRVPLAAWRLVREPPRR